MDKYFPAYRPVDRIEEVYPFIVDNSETITTLLIPYKASDLNSYIVELSYNNIRFYVNHGIRIKDGDIYSIKSPYKYGDLFDSNGLSRIQYIQNGDILYLFHPKYPVKTLYRNSDNEWFIEDFEFKNGPWQHVNTSNSALRVHNNDGVFTITSNIQTFNEGMVGKLIRLTIENTQVSPWVAKKQYYAGDKVLSDNKYYECSAAGISGDVKPTHTFGTRTDGGIMWEYKHSGYGIAKITEFINNATIKILPLDEFPNELTEESTQYWELSVFGGECVYPMCGAFYRGRFAVMADTNNIPTVYMSCSDDYDNFNDKDYGEVLDTNAITIPLYSNDYATSSFLISSNVLFAGTSSGEFSIDSATTSNPLSPSNVQQRQFSSFGSLPIRPVRVGSNILYVSKQGIGLRNIVYSFEKDGYESLDISLFGKHLLKSGIKQIVYQELPDKIVWIATQDGGLVGLTYMSEQNVVAYHRHDLKGYVQSIAVISNPDDYTEDLWLEINRNGINCIEWQDVGFNGGDYFYVDSGLSLTREFSRSFDEIIKETSGALANTDIVVGNTTYQGNGETVREIRVSGEENSHGVSSCLLYWFFNQETSYKFVLAEDLIGFEIEVIHFYTDGERKGDILVGGVSDSNILNFSATPKGTDNTIQINLYQKIKKEDVYISGLDHLEGKEVKVMVDGAELPNQIVEKGSIKVPYYATNITAGLPIESVFIPQILYITGNNGSGIGDVQRIDHITLMLNNSMGGKVGSDLDNLFEVFFRGSSEKMDNATPLYSGNKTVLINSNTSIIKEKGASVVVYNDSVFPMNILAIAPHLTSSGNGL